MKLNYNKIIVLVISILSCGCNSKQEETHSLDEEIKKVLRYKANVYYTMPENIRESYIEYLRNGDFESQKAYFTELFWTYCEIRGCERAELDEKLREIPLYLIYINKFNDLTKTYTLAYPELKNIKVSNFHTGFELNEKEFLAAKRQIKNNDAATKDYLHDLINELGNLKAVAGVVEANFRRDIHRAKLKYENGLTKALEDKRIQILLDEACELLLKLIRQQDKPAN